MGRYVFPALIEKRKAAEGYTVSFPDVPNCITEGNTMNKSLIKAHEILVLHLFRIEEHNDEIPKASNLTLLPKVEDGFYTLIEVYTGKIRDSQLDRTITKYVTLPLWLEIEATKAHLNLSQVLEDALKKELGIVDKRI